MSAQHTSGPLRVVVGANGDVGILDMQRNVVAECFAAIRRHDEQANAEALANARLFCAADSMLEMLRICVEVLRKVDPSGDPGSDEILSSTISVAELVIAAATGSTSHG